MADKPHQRCRRLRFVGELEAFADLIDRASNALHQRRQNHWPTLRARTRSDPAPFSGKQYPARRSRCCCALGAIGARKLDVVMKVGIPRWMPCFFGSLKVAITLALVGSVVSETIGANSGLGQMMLAAQAGFNAELVFAAVTALVERQFTGWALRAEGIG